jgi:hypothetical protein
MKITSANWFRFFFFSSALALAANPAAAAEPPCAPLTLDDLPRLPRNVVVEQFSSHNKKGVNGDADWFLYKDGQGDAVVFDAAGPGCIRSIWQTCVPGDQVLKFYFDGETKPRYTIPTHDFYRGKNPLFPAPLVSFEKRGYYGGGDFAGNCFVPIPFQKSLKIAMKGPVAFYHFLYERYPYGTPVTTFNGKEDRDYLLRAFDKQGEELSPPVGAEAVRRQSVELKPFEPQELLNVQKPGTIARLAIEGPATEEFVRRVEIAMHWDATPRPDVLAPLGIFFGPAVRPEAVRAMPVKVELLPEGRMRLTSYFRMPFWHNAQILLNYRPIGPAKPIGPIRFEASLIPNRYPEAETGHFCALYREGRTDMARDWLFFDAGGTGRFLGVVQTMHGEHYCEGNERFALDGAGSPQVHGTGSEDYYLACLWPNPNYNLPFAGCVGDITKIPGPACYYRFHLEAPIPFYSALDARIQHGGMSNIVSQYRSLGFCYLRRRPVLRQTDFIDVADTVSERQHAYQAAGSTLTGELEASYEGNAMGTLIRDSGRSHPGGEIAFTVATDPANAGVRLRRRLDQNTPRQAADVYVNNHFAGTWYHADQNPYLRWYDSDYDLPADLTRGKAELKIRLAVKTGQGAGAWTDFRYEAFVFENGGPGGQASPKR